MINVVRSLVLSFLEHCRVIWSSAAEKQLKKLEITQNRAAGPVLPRSFSANVCEMQRLSWLTVRLNLSVLLFISKCHLE